MLAEGRQPADVEAVILRLKIAMAGLYSEAAIIHFEPTGCFGRFPALHHENGSLPEASRFDKTQPVSFPKLTLNYSRID